MIESLAAVTLLAPTYDEAVGSFRDVLGFKVRKDRDLGAGKRWVVVGAPGGGGATIVLAVPGDDTQRARVGDQTGGRVGCFLQTDDFEADYEKLKGRGVRFLEEPLQERYGRVVVFADPWGGRPAAALRSSLGSR